MKEGGRGVVATCAIRESWALGVMEGERVEGRGGGVVGLWEKRTKEEEQEHAQEQGAGTGMGTMCTTVKDGVMIYTEGGKAIAAGAALHALHVRRCTVPVEVCS